MSSIYKLLAYFLNYFSCQLFKAQCVFHTQWILIWTGHMSCVQQPKLVASCPVGPCWFSTLNVLGMTILLLVSMHYSEIIVSFFAFFSFFLHEHHTVSFSLSKRFDGLIPMYYESYCVNNRAQEFWTSCYF